jgi:ribonuclease G
MANPKNRTTVEEALKTELERDRTKTYVVEISPLGLVEMTRQNVTDGPREILTRKCPVCEGDGVIVSDASVAIDDERKLLALAAGSRHKAFKVAVNDHVAGILVGPGARRLMDIEAHARRRFVLEPREDVPHDFFEVLGQGTLEKLQGDTPVPEGTELQVKLVEVGKHDVRAGMGSRDGYTICVGNAASMVGKSVKVRIERFVDGTAYASLVSKTQAEPEPITAEGQAEKPTRKPPTRKTAAKKPAVEEPPEEKTEALAEQPAEEPRPKKKTRRGSRGGRGRKKKTTAATEGAVAQGGAEADGAAPTPKIHVPEPTLGEAPAEPEPVSANGDSQSEAEGQPKPKKRTRRGSRGGRNRKKKTAAATSTNGGDQSPDAAEPEGEPASDEYVPMSQWIDEVDSR